MNESVGWISVMTRKGVQVRRSPVLLACLPSARPLASLAMGAMASAGISLNGLCSAPEDEPERLKLASGRRRDLQRAYRGECQ